MYRLVLYCLIALLACAQILTIFSILPYGIYSIPATAVLLMFVCWATNRFFSWICNAPTNFESVYISALILTLIINPIDSVPSASFAILTGIIAMVSKYVFAIKRKHIFNPAAFGVLTASLLTHQAASWWVGTQEMVIPTLIVGFLIIKKVRRFSLVLSFLFVCAVLTSALSVLHHANPTDTLRQLFMTSPLLFFASVMLTEPLTTPPKKSMQMIYGALVALGIPFTTAETTLILGNIFSAIVGPKQRYILTLQKKIQIAPDTYKFLFKSSAKLSFHPGQYLEWTLGHKHQDSRGTRRYFTIASSPTENEIEIGVKVFDTSSSFKAALCNLKAGDIVTASGPYGEFVLPPDIHKKMVCVAGGIGITPFRSMVKFLLDTNQKRPITLIYANKLASEIVYGDIFDQAEKELGIKVIYTLTDDKTIPTNWKGCVGRVDEKLLQKEVPDFKNSHFYLSGPHTMVTSYEELLHKMGVARSNIKTDFFPGYV